ncbi:MAG: PASTA domain-containing protein [Dysgonamonadaceae bacterium]|jgi:beta-lactam-binding protein with PASTA domain|nr:PASTA domain-containing protein [Dysgonamonadaceae bacterium]
MNKKKYNRDVRGFLGNSIVKNLLAVAVLALCLLLLTLFLLRIYTRHNNDVIVPSLYGLQMNEAKVILTSKGLHAEIVDSIYRKNSVPGAILSQIPKADNKVKKGRAIYVTVYSKNPQQVAVPGVMDYSSRQALALLNSIGFTQIDIERIPSQYEGLVIGVEYRGKRLSPDEKVPAGSALKLVVGNGGGVMPDSLGVDGNSIVPPDGRETQASSQDDLDGQFF